MKKIIQILLALLLSSALYASTKQNDDVDYVALATLLMKDAHYSRANEALTHVNLEDETLDKAQYYTLKGLVDLKLNKYRESNKNFQLAIDNGQTEKSIYLYIAQNNFKLKDYEATIDALSHAKELVKSKPKIMALKAESYFRLKKYNDALMVLSSLNELHPEYYYAYRQRFTYFIKLKLYQSALKDAQVYLAHAKLNEKVTISFINALRKAKETDKATLLAENAHLQYSDNATVTVLLANLYIDKDMIQAAADLFDEASLQDEKYIKDSSEMFRRAKDFVQALYKNSQILDTKEKYKQKVAIYLEFGNYEKVVATENALKRNGLLKEQNMLYALAYSLYKIGNYKHSEMYLKKITQSDLFQKSIELRKNMNKCKNNHWECTL